MSQITWKEFLIAILLIVIIYYLIVVSVYYLKPSKFQWLAKALSLPNQQIEQASGLQKAEETPETIIKSLIIQAGAASSPKEEILFALKNYLLSTEAFHINEIAFKANITQLVIDECQKYCSIHLSEEDLRVLWV